MATPASNLEAAVNTLASINGNTLGNIPGFAAMKTAIDAIIPAINSSALMIEGYLRVVEGAIIRMEQNVVNAIKGMNLSGGININAAGGVTVTMDDKNIVAELKTANLKLNQVSQFTRKTEWATTYLAKANGATVAELQKMNAWNSMSMQMQSLQSKLLRDISNKQNRFGGGNNPNANTGGRKGPYANIEAIGDQLAKTGSIILNQFTKPMITAGKRFYNLSPALAGFRLAFESTNQGLMRLGLDLTKVPQALGVLGGALKETAVLVHAGFSKMITGIIPLVGAFDPATLQMFNLAVKDLMAVFGRMFRPILIAATGIIRTFADAMMPVAEFLEPIFQEFASAMIDVAVPYVIQLALLIAEAGAAFQNMIPALTDIASVILPLVITMFRGLISIVNIIVGLFNLFMTGLNAMIGALLKAAAWITSWFSKGAKDKLNNAADKAFGNADYYKKAASKSFEMAFDVGNGNVAKKLGPITQGGSAGMAAKSASFSGISELGKGMMQAAFSSSTQNAALQTADNTKRIADKIDVVANAVGLQVNRRDRAMAGVRR